ncbi:YhbD family protein [Paenibacillus sp. GSMTC-2017]|uniref:YhbD family protein n=1 Tax=Paenibacillus sp. GSMTC-2017 TaxID=2794350 RepID=UPI0018D983A0|nr:YhbD family protein [Paenibacillus sp. GSMTC-2017]
MTSELISKKELLDATGISYGQLYRWKRKQLIPEEWFIRKSAFTGQETFFPKDLVLARIDKILNMKDELSLDDLADKLSTSIVDLELRKNDFISRNLVSEVVIQTMMSDVQADHIYSFEQMLHLYVVEGMLQSGEISRDEGKLLLETLQKHSSTFKGNPYDVIFIRRMGISSFALMSSSAELIFDDGVKVVTRLSMSNQAEQLKEKLG